MRASRGWRNSISVSRHATVTSALDMWGPTAPSILPPPPPDSSAARPESVCPHSSSATGAVFSPDKRLFSVLPVKAKLLFSHDFSAPEAAGHALECARRHVTRRPFEEQPNISGSLEGISTVQQIIPVMATVGAITDKQ